MYLFHYLDELECETKKVFRELDLSKHKGKEKYFPQLFEIVVESLFRQKSTDKKKDSFKKDLETHLKYLYRDEEYVHPNAAKEIRMIVSKQFTRLYEYLVKQDFEVVDKGSGYNVKNELDNTGLIYYNYDLTVKRTDGSIEAIIFNTGKPKYSYSGRKFETKVFNSIELNSLLSRLRKLYPEHEVRASIYYLRNKEDKKQLFPDFNHKKGTNIVSIALSEVRKKYVLKEDADIEDYFENITSEYLSHEPKKDCKKCKFKKICSFENKINTEFVDNSLLKEQTKLKEKISNNIVLNEDQERILENLQGISQVVAVPGAGKTRIIVEGIKRLIKKNVEPKSILVLTFTNKATEELKERLGDINKVVITNYNTFGYKLVRKFYKELDFQYPPRLVTQYESFEYLREILELFRLDFRYEYLYHKDYGQMHELYRAVKYVIAQNLTRNSMLLPFEERILSSKFKLQNGLLNYVLLIAISYKRKLRDNHLISYEQQIELVNELFKKNKYVLEMLKNKFEYVFLDEYQDTNPEQHKMITSFSVNNVLCVGDEDQNLYSFNGATPKNFLEFMKEGDNKFFLSKNYRSGARIIQEANRLISQNTIRNNKFIIPAGDRLGIYEEHAMSSSSDIVSIINSVVEKNILLSDIAIITRKNKHIVSLTELLKENGYNIQTNYNRLLEDTDYIKFKAFMNVLDLSSTREDEYIVMKHIYGVDDIPEGKIINELIASGNVKALQFLEDLGVFNQLENSKEQLGFIFELIGSYKCVVHDYLLDLTKQLYLLNMKELLSTLNGIEEIDEDITIKIEGDGINLLTAHSSKGLEFKVVIVYCVEDFQNRGDLEEERRLLYVAMTRAENELHLTSLKESEKQVLKLKEVI